MVSYTTLFELDAIDPQILNIQTTKHILGPSKAWMRKCVQSDHRYETVRVRHVHMSMEVKRNLSDICIIAYSVHKT